MRKRKYFFFILLHILYTAAILPAYAYNNLQPPSIVRIEFDIITPDSLFIAGQPISAVVSIYDENGLVPGTWKFPGDPGSDNQAKYLDILGTGGLNYIPFVTTSEDMDSLDDTANVDQWFYDGIDTLEFMLFYAPADQTPHQLKVILDTLSASTDTISLKPGPINAIILIPDFIPVLTYEDPSFIIEAWGIDQFGNKITNELFTWSNDSTLVDFNINAVSTQIFINPSNATEDQDGDINVTSVTNQTIKTDVYFKVLGPKSELQSAVTRDYNGNGYLDAIDLQFDEAFTIPDGYEPYNIIVQKSITENVFFQVDSLTPAPFSDGKRFLLHLNEEQSIEEKIPQTSWTPVITIDDLNVIQIIDRVTCEDSAAPVIWDIYRDVEYLYDITKDKIKVTFSENIFHSTGSPFLSANPKPEEVFKVCYYDSLINDTIQCDSILTGINQFDSLIEDSVFFTLSNEGNPKGYHFFNLKNNSYVADKYGNIPLENNQKVSVFIRGIIESSPPSGPYSVYPTYEFYKNEKDLPLFPISLSEAYNRIKEFGGTYIAVFFEQYNFFNNSIGEMVIYDKDGYILFHKESNNLLDVKQPLDSIMPYSFIFFWDGLTNNEEKAKEGNYFISARVTNGNNMEEATLKAYVEKTEPYNKNETSRCGAGIGLALIPPIGFKLTSRYKRKRKYV